jgi:hypothetical protein
MDCFQRIVWNPTEEVADLRSSDPIAKLPATPLKADTPVSLEAAAASDIELFFQVRSPFIH